MEEFKLKLKVKEPCTHEFVSVQYASSPYGHCHLCDCTVVKDEEGKWKLP